MPKVFALLVGIDSCRSPGLDLQDMLAELVRSAADPSRPQPGMQTRPPPAADTADDWAVTVTEVTTRVPWETS